MLRGPHVLLAVALAAATLGGCGSDPQHTGAPARTISPTTGAPTPTPGATRGAGASPGPGSPVPVGTGVTGRAVLVRCPVDRADPPCPGVPVQAGLALLDAGTQAVVASVDTDAEGRFTVDVPAGTYLVRPVRIAGTAAPRPVSTQVVVVSGHYTSVTLRLDDRLP